MKKTILGAVVLASLSFGAQAELISTDVSELGDAKATLDNTTGLEWLDVSETFNYSYNELLAEMASGGAFEGWRFATRSELEALITSETGFLAHLNQTSLIHQGSNYTYDKGVAFNDFLTGVAKTSYGFTMNDNGLLSLSGVNANESNAYYWHGNYGLNVSYGHIGHWLVSGGGTTLSSVNNPNINIIGFSGDINATADVPVTLSGLMLAAGLMGLRRRKAVVK